MKKHEIYGSTVHLNIKSSPKNRKRSFLVTKRNQKLDLIWFLDESTWYYVGFHWSKSLSDDSQRKFRMGGPLFLDDFFDTLYFPKMTHFDFLKYERPPGGVEKRTFRRLFPGMIEERKTYFLWIFSETGLIGRDTPI